MKVSLPKKTGKKRAVQKPSRIQDIGRVSSGTVLDLKKKSPAVQIDMSQVREWWYRHQHKFFIIASIVIGALVLSSFSTGHASIATFYPSSCLGDWEHAENAQGEPSVPDESDATQFSLENSARMPGSVSSIYCGGFKGVIPENSMPTKYKLTLSWSVDDASVVHETSDAVESDPVLVAPTDGEEVAPEEAPIDAAPTDTSEVTTPETNDSVPAEPAAEPAAEPSPEVPTTQSFLDHFFASKVLAQESDPAPEPVVPETPVIEEAPVEEPVNETPPQETVAEPSTPIVEEVPTSEESGVEEVSPEVDEPVVDDETSEVEPVAEEESAPDTFMEVEYTLDGTEWKSLGTISRSEWQRASFDLPLESWENLDSLQVALKTVPTFDTPPVVYLDAMQISVEYTDMPNLVAPPTVMLEDDADLINGKEDYSSTETVTFDLTSPNLTVDDIKELVDEGRATIVKDTGGVLGEKVEDPEVTEQVQDSVDALKDTVEETKEIITPPPIDVTPPPVDMTTSVSFLQKLFAPSVASAASAQIDAVVLDDNGNETNINATVVLDTVDGQESHHVEIDRPREFRPGQYTLVVTFTTPQAIIVSQQDFRWGVLVINTNKSVFVPGDNAYIQMGVLNDAGHTICTSDLDLDITSPSGVLTTLSTDDGSIVRDPECGPDNVIAVPDYYAHFSIPSEIGTYNIELTSQTDNGTKTITDSFVVEHAPGATVERIGPSRIYPVALYPMTIKVTSPVDWQGVVSERVPESFDISQPERSTPYNSIDIQGDTKIISWDVFLVAGQEVTLGYYFNAPDISPEFYILGKAALVSGSTTKFEEVRNWQIASDAACNATADGTWSATANFLNCTGAASAGAGTGLRPGINDDLTINTGVNVTVDTSVTIKSLIFATLATGSPSVDIANGVTLTVTGVTGINAAGSGSNNTITVGGGTSGALVTGGLTVSGSGSAGRNSILSLPAGGTLTTSNGITFAGTAGQARFTNNAAATINLTGTFSAGGTITINSGTTLVTTGTSAIANPATFGNLNVSSGTTSLGAIATTFAGTTTIDGTLTASSATGTKTFTGGVTVNSGGSFDMSAVNPALSFGGGITMNGTTFDAGTGATAFTASQNLAGANNMTFGGAVTISDTFTVTNTNTGTVTFSGNVTGAGATASLATGSGSTTKFAGTVMSTGTLVPSTSLHTIEYNGGAQTIKVPTTNPYYNLTVSAAGIKSLAGTTSVTGTTSITDGSIDTVTGQNYALNTGTMSIGASGTLTAQNSTITVTGNWSNSGTFTAGNSTVLMNGAATAIVSGTNTFYNLTITHTGAKEVDFQTSGSPTFHITNVFTVTGSAGNLIKLYSDASPTQWTIHPTGTASLDYIDVKDSACASGSITMTPGHFTNSGNNGTCWASSSTLTFAISDPTVGFGVLSASNTSYATGDTLGSSSQVEAHTITIATSAANGYTLSVRGPTLTSGSNTIAAIGGSNTAPSVGTPQFGLRMTATGGSGTVSSPYAASGFAYAASAATPSTVASATTGDGVATTYSARYMCNISSATAAGQYSTNLTYVVTANF